MILLFALAIILIELGSHTLWPVPRYILKSKMLLLFLETICLNSINLHHIVKKQACVCADKTRRAGENENLPAK